MASESSKSGLLTDISEHLGPIFRHTLPGVVVVGSAAVAYPKAFNNLDVTSWQHFLLLAVATMTVGNACFALNRYGVHQFADYCLYLIKSGGPSRGDEPWNYLTDLGRYTAKSLHAGDESSRARQHVGFRASTVLLLLTIGEMALIFSYHHSSESKIQGYDFWVRLGGMLALASAFWQMIITRRIDLFVVNPEKPHQ